jgi:Na+-driven multidrug efflux pump
MEAIQTQRPGALRRAWATLKEAVAGSEQDFTEGSLGRAVVLLAVPMILEMSMESVFGVLDVFFVGRLGPGAVAAVGLTEAMLTIVFAVAMGLSLSTTAMVARRIGEKDPEGASATAVQAIALGLLVAVPSGIVGVLYARELLGLMGAPAEVAAQGAVYTAWILGGNATILLLFLINAIFRGAGDASLAMRSLWLANLVNVVLDPCLIFGLGPFPELGLAGAAIGTTVGRGVGVLYQLRAIAKGPRIVIERRHLKLQWDVMGRLLYVSAGGIAQFLIATGSWLGLVLILTPFGAGALAGYTIAVRIVVVAILPAWGSATPRRRSWDRTSARRSPNGPSARCGSRASSTWRSSVSSRSSSCSSPTGSWGSSRPTRRCGRSVPRASASSATATSSTPGEW